MDAARIIETDFALEVRGQILIAEGRYDTGEEADGQRATGVYDDACGRADDDSAGKSSVEEVFHGELVFKEGAGHKSGETTARQRHDCVGNDLRLCVGSDGEHSIIEGRPKHPQKQRTDEGEDV